MKNYIVFIILWTTTITSIIGQVTIGTRYVKEAFIVNFENIGNKPRIRINLDNDFKDLYAVQQMTDTTLVFKDKNEKKEFDKQFKDKEKVIEKIISLNVKIADSQSKGKKKDVDKFQKELGKIKIPTIDISPYLTNREFIKPGMQVEIDFERFSKDSKNVVHYITVITDFDREQTIKNGILEKIGEVSIVDGRMIKLEPGAFIEGDGNPKGKNGSYKGKKFYRFSEMQYGMELDLIGKNQKDGILYVKKGKARPNELTETDIKLIERLRKGIRINTSKVSMGQVSYALIQNRSVQNYVEKIGKSLIPSFLRNMAPTEEGYVNFRFYVVNDSNFNACAYPDGTVFVHTGLLVEIDNPSQLAAILGHEIAHVVYHHGRNSYDDNRTVKTVQGVADIVSAYGMENKDQLFEMARAFGGPFLLSSFSRKYENQADRNGLIYVANAGYDPREAPKIWEKLYQKAKLEEDDNENAIENGIVKLSKNLDNAIYSSHPQALERYRNLNLLLAQSFQTMDFASDKTKFEQQTKEYRSIKASVAGGRKR